MRRMRVGLVLLGMLLAAGVPVKAAQARTFRYSPGGFADLWGVNHDWVTWSTRSYEPAGSTLQLARLGRGPRTLLPLAASSWVDDVQLSDRWLAFARRPVDGDGPGSLYAGRPGRPPRRVTGWYVGYGCSSPAAFDFSLDGERLATIEVGCDTRFVVRNLRTGRIEASFPVSEGREPRTLDLRGRWLAWTDGDYVSRFMDLRSRRVVKRVSSTELVSYGPGDPVSASSGVGADGTFFASASSGGAFGAHRAVWTRRGTGLHTLPGALGGRYLEGLMSYRDPRTGDIGFADLRGRHRRRVARGDGGKRFTLNPPLLGGGNVAFTRYPLHERDFSIEVRPWAPARRGHR